MSDITHLAWIDLETNNLDVDHCHVLEVGMIVTDLQMEEVAWFDALCFNGQLVDYLKMVANLDPYVRQMHTDNGLLRELNLGLNPREKPKPGEEQRPVWLYDWVDVCLSTILTHEARPTEVLLAGSGSSRFDRRIIERVFPLTYKYLHYADIDIGIMRRFTGILGLDWMIPSPGKENIAHRAMPDCLSALDQARAFGDFLTRAALTKGDAHASTTTDEG